MPSSPKKIHLKPSMERTNEQTNDDDDASELETASPVIRKPHVARIVMNDIAIFPICSEPGANHWFSSSPIALCRDWRRIVSFGADVCDCSWRRRSSRRKPTWQATCRTAVLRPCRTPRVHRVPFVSIRFHACDFLLDMYCQTYIGSPR